MIPFNKPPYFPGHFAKAMQDAHTYGQFSGDGINSSKCAAFFSENYGFEHSLLTPSCTASLEMAALILDLQPGDEVIVPSFTFVTSANAFALRRVNLIFADSMSENPNVSVEDILSKVTAKTKAIVVVHYAGVAVDVHQLLDATNGSIPIVEDCAHAIHSIDPLTGDYVGKAGCMSTFSFHQTKNVGIGEGGLLVVNDESLWRKAQIVREKGTNRTDFLVGRTAFYTWVDLGSSYLMSDVDAAMLWSALQNIQKIQSQRLKLWDVYDEKLQDVDVFKKPSHKVRGNAHMYYLQFHSTAVLKKFVKFMKSKKILVATHYVPLDTCPFAQTMREKKIFSEQKHECANSATWSASLVRLPLFFDLCDDDVDTVISTINDFALRETLQLVNAEEKYWDEIRQIRNANRQCFAATKEINKEEHWSFMRKYSQTYRVAVQDGKCVGFIGHVSLDVRMATNLKGKGVAQFMWTEFEKEYDGLLVKVLRNNPRSLRFFKKLGYSPDTDALATGTNPVPLLKTVVH